MLQNDYEVVFSDNANGDPGGGTATALGIDITFQDGPVLEDGQNGAFVETLIEIVIKRLEYYQESRFICGENARAIVSLKEALYWLNVRTKDRIKRGVEGKYEA